MIPDLIYRSDLANVHLSDKKWYGRRGLLVIGNLLVELQYNPPGSPSNALCALCSLCVVLWLLGLPVRFNASPERSH